MSNRFRTALDVVQYGLLLRAFVIAERVRLSSRATAERERPRSLNSYFTNSKKGLFAVVNMLLQKYLVWKSLVNSK